ncbi:MAG: FAD-dependent monooxygenase, partial [Proteobacteria bacterium]|nr:FAD-dependent monooxygenase [Pseudomonadota bacterium]
MSNSMENAGNGVIPVVIVGGGPVGLALASELGWRGVPCLLVERRDGSIGHPKMNQVSARTVEFCRRWGLSGKVRQQSIAEDFPRNIKFCHTTAGYLFAGYEFPSRGEVKTVYSPEALQRCSQLWFDAILRDHVLASPSVEVRYQTLCTSVVQDESGVTVELEDQITGESETVRAGHLVACDGAESGIRDALHIDLTGDQSLSFNINVFFRSPDHDALFAHGRATMQWMFDENGLW